MKTATDKLYAEGDPTAVDYINAGGTAVGQILNGVASIKYGQPPVTNNYTTYESQSSESNTKIIIIVAAVLVVAVVGVVLFTRSK